MLLQLSVATSQPNTTLITQRHTRPKTLASDTTGEVILVSERTRPCNHLRTTLHKDNFTWHLNNEQGDEIVLNWILSIWDIMLLWNWYFVFVRFKQEIYRYALWCKCSIFCVLATVSLWNSKFSKTTVVFLLISIMKLIYLHIKFNCITDLNKFFKLSFDWSTRSIYIAILSNFAFMGHQEKKSHIKKYQLFTKYSACGTCFLTFSAFFWYMSLCVTVYGWSNS